MDVRQDDRATCPVGRNKDAPPKNALRAFTLVEVALTMGVVTFALIAIFSLISLSLRYSRDANVRQGLTLAMDQTISMYQGQNFTNSLALSQVQTNYYFDNTGLLLPNSTGAFFKSSVSNVTASGAITNFLATLQIQVIWPYPTSTSTNLFVFSILNPQ